MRIFAAIVPPEPALEDLADFLAPRHDAESDLRWTDREQWHVTLAFMADVPDHSVERVVGAVQAAAAARPPVQLAIGGGGAFPHPYDARVLWTGVHGEQQELTSLARGVRHSCAHAGGAPKGGPFRAHLTLARMRRPTEATRWIHVLEEYLGPSWTAREVSVIASHLGEGPRRRSRYEHLAAAPLAPL
jgi:2'-5' RNA ligase